ncbi:MAG: SDR family oxidoreductase [Planctomycetes bacterium]|nr:SDR family oxidoreductase [Planctomycetota bacterium]
MSGAALAPLTGWALILGASSGFGEACALELAGAGLDILGVHLDRRETLPNAERIAGEIRGQGRKALFVNMNAADPDKRKEALDLLAAEGTVDGAPPCVRVLLHSLAFGTLLPYFGEKPEAEINPKQMDMTLNVMAHSLVWWTQDLVRRKLLRDGSRIFAMTSAGSSRIWKSYGAVSAAKSALESHIRQIAYELSAQGITANAIRAGVTDTPALRKIPGHEAMIDAMRKGNPGGRTTTPQDIARALVAFAQPGTRWLTGNVLGVDGGEILV